MNQSRNIGLRLTLVLFTWLFVLNGLAQADLDTLVNADSTIHIYLSSSDTIVIHHTDTVMV